MGNIPFDIDLKLDNSHVADLLSARINERTALINKNDWARKLYRKLNELPAPAQNSPGVLMLKAKIEENETLANNYRAAFNQVKANAKTAHNVTDDVAEEYFDPSRGVLILKAEPTALIHGTPKSERRRLALSDQQCDQFTASYIASCTAQDEAFDLSRQIEDYLVANPPEMVNGEPVIDPDYEALRAAYDAKIAIVNNEQAIQGQIINNIITTNNESHKDGWSMNIATGDLILY